MLPSINAIKLKLTPIISDHEGLKRQRCLYCRFRFEARVDLERHMNALHYKLSSWACNNISGWQAAYTQGSSESVDICCYCGERFGRSGPGVLTQNDWLVRADHLHECHEYDRCNDDVQFYRADHFREHLRRFHVATAGDDINILVDACMKIDDHQVPEGHESSAWPDSIAGQDESLNVQTTQSFSSLDATRDHIINQYGSLFVNPKLSACPESLKQYMRLSRALERIKSDRNLLFVLSANVDRSSDSEAYKDLCKAGRDMDNHLFTVSTRLTQARQSCWKQGFDLSFIDDALISNHVSQSKNREGATELPETWESILRNAELGAQITKKDRINAWLLHNLAISTEESTHHRSYLFKRNELSEEEWSRLVLKYWPVDEVAMGHDLSACSTNDVEHSSWIQHSVDLYSELLPIHKKREVAPDLASSSDQAPRKKPRISTG